MTFTRDDIIRMAHESYVSQTIPAFLPMTDEALERFAEMVAAAERESCVKICEEVSARRRAAGNNIGFNAIMECSEAIRARSAIAKPTGDVI